MGGIKRAFFVASAERYVSLLVSFVTLAVIARLLSPHEIGLTVVGTSLLVLAQSVRDFGASTYIVQTKTLSKVAVCSTVSITILIALVFALAFLVFAAPLAGLYREPLLADYFRLLALALLFGTFCVPLSSLLQRDMAFGSVAAINITGVIVGALVAIALAAAGCGFMSIAWAALAQSMSSVAVATWLRPEFWVFRPDLREWRAVLAFGSYSSTSFLLGRLYDFLPYLVVGWLLPMDAIGRFSRTVMVCDLPLKGLLTGLFPVALPALLHHVRQGHSLKAAYLESLALITGVLWPALVGLALVAEPVVQIVLGEQWLDIVPLVRLTALATLFTFPVSLTYPVLVAAGAVRQTIVVNLIALPVSALVLLAAAHSGLTAMVSSLFLTLPFASAVALIVVRRELGFAWAELATALRKSVVVTSLTAVGPTAALLASGEHGPSGWLASMVVILLGIFGWVASLFWIEHPLKAHICSLRTGRYVASSSRA